jgi:hypothetical protein
LNACEATERAKKNQNSARSMVMMPNAHHFDLKALFFVPVRYQKGIWHKPCSIWVTLDYPPT